VQQLQSFNQDGTNTCTISLNGSTSFTLSAGGSFNVNDQNIVSVRITAGAAGGVDVVGQVAPTLLTTEAQRFGILRG
jgi:hypothetical protein